MTGRKAKRAEIGGALAGRQGAEAPQGVHGAPPPADAVQHPRLPVLKIPNGWEAIDTAPTDGRVIVVGTLSAYSFFFVPYPLHAKYADGKWLTKFGREWAPYSPQPNVWLVAGTDE